MGDTCPPCSVTGSLQPSIPAQKCDAKRPCTTCISAKNISECIYDSEKHPQSAGVYPVHRADGHPSGQEPGGASPIKTPAVTPTDLPVEQNLIPPTSDAIEVATHDSSALQTPEGGQDQIPHVRSSGLVRVQVRGNSSGLHVSPDSSLSISAILPFLFSKIPPEPRIPLSFLGGEKLQIQTSEAAATDLDMRWCALE